jgi:receptor expression-enhancing protein 5/6
MVLVGGIVFIAILFFGIGAGSLCSIVGFLYPAFKSFEAIESKTRGDDTQWLIYWVVYAFFAVIETFSDFLLYWIPFYYAFKVRLQYLVLQIAKKNVVFVMTSSHTLCAVL